MKRIFISIICVICLTSDVRCQDLSAIFAGVEYGSENLTVLQKWQTIERNLKRVSGSLVKMVLPHALKVSESLNISSQCTQEALKLVMGLKNLKPWAFKFLDSSGKSLDGLLSGSIASLGIYNECIETEVKNEKGKDKGKILFRGQYCTIDVKPPLPPMAKYYRLWESIPELKNLTGSGTVISEAVKLASTFYFVTIKLGICVPSGCTVEDLDQVVRIFSKSTLLDAKTSRCEVKEDLKLTNLNICVMFIYCFFGFLMLIGSSIDMYCYYTGAQFKGTLARIFLSFSFISNFQKFINTKTTSDTLGSLHGIRFLSMTWIILGHTYFLLDYEAVQQAEKALSVGENFAFQVVLNGNVAVDSFFCIGGLLVCYLTLKSVNSEGRTFSVFMYIVHRLWRIYPVYIFVILYNFLDYIISSGPLMYHASHRYVDNCYENWWANLLFINNFYAVDKACLAHSWYIASDIQLYLAVLLILLPMLRWPKGGILLTVLAITASIIFTAVQTYVKDLPPTMLIVRPHPGDITEYWKAMYFTPFAHVGPYCVGLLAGYLLYTKPNLKMPATVQLIGWASAFICCFSVVYGAYNWNRGKEINFAAGMMYAAFHRTAWASGVAWMIVCCATGHGGVINYILSWKIFIPLGRLTFFAYLVHPLVQVTFMANLKHVFVMDHFFVVWIFFGDLFVSYAIAFAGCMLVESPMMALEKIIFKKGEKKTEDPTFVRSSSIMNGTLKLEKFNGDIAIMVNNDSEKSSGIDNAALSTI